MNSFDTLIRRLDPVKLCQYLMLQKWTEIDGLYDGKVRQFLNIEKGEAVILPMENSFSDYDQVIMRFVSTLARLEGMTEKGIFNKLLNPSCDILKWRIADDTTFNGAISFASMGTNIDYIKDMLGAACLDMKSPNAYHSKLYTKEVQDQLSKYSFGQTEIGSYILNVLCPLGYYQYQLFDPSEEQFPDSRRINLRLLRNINRIQKSAEDCSQEMRDNVEVGNISVNFLSSLIGLYETNKDAELTISADWNPSVPLPESEIVSNVILKPRCLDRVMSVIEDFTPKEEQNIEKTYVGKIINIGAEAEVNNREMVDIKVAVIGENLRTMTVNVSLSYTDNITVVDQAFQTGADVKVTGIKTSTSRSVKLSNASIEVI